MGDAKDYNQLSQFKCSEEDPPESDECTEIDWHKVHVDDIWHTIGRFGKFQVIQLALMCFLTVTIVCPVLSGMFAGKAVTPECGVNNSSAFSSNYYYNESIVVSSCSVQLIDNTTSKVLTEMECTHHEYDEQDLQSFLSEWNLVCDREALGQLPQVLTMVGMGLGATFLPQIGDSYGRKKLVTGCFIVVFLASLAQAFVKDFEVFVVFKMIAGGFQQGLYVTLYTMQVEIMPMELRTFVSLLTVSFWTVAFIFVGVVGYIFQDYAWRDLQLVFALVNIPGLICLWFLAESLRWLIGNSRDKETVAFLQKACKLNGKDYHELMDKVTNAREDEEEMESPLQTEKEALEEEMLSTTEKVNAFSFLKHPILRKMICVMCYTWMICSLTYYGLTLLSTSLAGDPFVNYFLLCIVEFPSGFATYFSMKKYGRRATLIVCNAISGVALILVVFVVAFAPSTTPFVILQTVLTLIGKFFVSGTFGAIWIYTPELFPTNLRNVGTGIASTAARIGASFSPLIAILARKAIWAPGVLFGVGSIICAFMLTVLPETRWKELPMDITDVESWYKKDGSKKRKDITLEVS